MLKSDNEDRFRSDDRHNIITVFSNSCMAIAHFKSKYVKIELIAGDDLDVLSIHPLELRRSRAVAR